MASIDDDRFSLIFTVSCLLNNGKSGNLIDFELNRLNENSYLVYANLVRNSIDTILIIIKRGFREVEPKLINLGYNFKYFRKFRYTRVGKYIKGVI